MKNYYPTLRECTYTIGIATMVIGATYFLEAFDPLCKHTQFDSLRNGVIAEFAGGLVCLLARENKRKIKEGEGK